MPNPTDPSPTTRTYELTGPDGKTFEVSGPGELSDADIAHLVSTLPAATTTGAPAAVSPMVKPKVNLPLDVDMSAVNLSTPGHPATPRPVLGVPGTTYTAHVVDPEEQTGGDAMSRLLGIPQIGTGANLTNQFAGLNTQPTAPPEPGLSPGLARALVPLSGFVLPPGDITPSSDSPAQPENYDPRIDSLHAVDAVPQRAVPDVPTGSLLDRLRKLGISMMAPANQQADAYGEVKDAFLPPVTTEGAAAEIGTDAARNFVQGATAPGLGRTDARAAESDPGSPNALVNAAQVLKDVFTDVPGNVRSGIDALLHQSGPEKIGSVVPSLAPSTIPGAIYNAATSIGSNPLNFVGAGAVGDASAAATGEGNNFLQRILARMAGNGKPTAPTAATTGAPVVDTLTGEVLPAGSILPPQAQGAPVLPPMVGGAAPVETVTVPARK